MRSFKTCTLHKILVIKPRRMRWLEHVACMGAAGSTYRIFVRKSEGKRPLRRPRYRWEDNIRMDLVEKRWQGVDWIQG
jgi:hypothetical protein